LSIENELSFPSRGIHISMRRIVPNSALNSTLLLLLSILLLSSCATYPMKVPAETRSKVRRIAVISLLGDSIHQKYIGTSVFTNTDQYCPVNDWKMDCYITQLIREELCRNHYECVDVDARSVSVEKLFGSVDLYDRRRFKVDDVRKHLEEIASENNVDLFLLVTRGRGEDPVSGQSVYGYAVLRKSFLAQAAHVRVHVSANILVVDPRTMRVSAGRPLYAIEEIEQGIWRNDLSELNNEEMETLEGSIKRILNEQTPSALRKLELIS
jgi:hypothetical protein